MNTLISRNIDYFILLLILIIATVARVENLNNSLWYDEIFTLINFIRLPLEDLISIYASFNNHPLYSLQANISVLLFGEHNWSIRLPATVFGIASIAAMWRLAYFITGPLQAHVIALLLALSYHHVWFSQNARGYTEVMFWCIVSTIILLKCLKAPSWGKWCSYSLILTAGIYTHLTAIVFFLAQGIYVYIIILFQKECHSVKNHYRKKINWLMPTASFMIVGLLSLVLYSPSIEQLFESIVDVSNTSSKDVMKEYQSPMWAAVEILRSIATPSYLTSISIFIAIALTGVGIFSIYKKEPLIPIIFILHVILLMGLLLALSMRIWPRFFFIDIGFILFFMIQGIYVLCEYTSTFIKSLQPQRVVRKRIFLFVSALLVTIFYVLNLKNYQYPKQDFNSSINYIKKHPSQLDNIVTLGLASTPYNKYFNMDWEAIESKDELEKIEEIVSDTKIIIIFPSRTFRKYPDITTHIEKNYFLEKTFKGTLGDGDILLYSKYSTN